MVRTSYPEDREALNRATSGGHAGVLQVAGAAITDTLVIMAVAMTLVRTLSLAFRANHIRGELPVASVVGPC